MREENTVTQNALDQYVMNELALAWAAERYLSRALAIDADRTAYTKCDLSRVLHDWQRRIADLDALLDACQQPAEALEKVAA